MHCQDIFLGDCSLVHQNPSTVLAIVRFWCTDSL